MKNFINKKLWILLLFILQIFLFYSLFYRYLHRLPFIQSDEAEYVYQGFSVFNNLFLLHYTPRPIFSIFSIIIMKIFNLPYVYGLLLTLNTVIYHIILLCSLWYITRNLKLPKTIFLCTVSIIYSLHLFFELSTVIYGDVPVLSWIFLTTALLFSLFNRKYRKLKLLFIGIVLALGVQTKPIFLFASVILIFSFLLIYISGNLLAAPQTVFKRCSKIVTNSLIVFLGFLPVLYFVLPVNLMRLIRELNYNNEKMEYWMVYHGLFNTVLWFPMTVFILFSLFIATILTVSFLGKFILIIKEFIDKITSDFSAQTIKDYYLKLTQNRVSFLVLSFIIMFLYISFFVQTKDGRTFLFLFPIFALLSVIAMYSLINETRVFNISLRFKDVKKSQFFCTLFDNLLIAILICNIFCTAGWFYTKQNNPDYKNTHILNLISKIDDYNDKHEKFKNLIIFLPHNAIYNNTVFNTVSMFSSDLYGFLPDIRKKIKSKQFFTSANYYHGSTYCVGGIPERFFTANFVILVKNNYAGTFKGQAEIYNSVIAKKLSEQNPLFLEGLVPIYTTKNYSNEEIIVYKRAHTVKVESFAKIVDIFAQNDKYNMFNVPYMYQALLIKPDLKNLRDQMDKMSDIKFIKSVDYNYETSKNTGMIKRILADWRLKSRQNSGMR